MPYQLIDLSQGSPEWLAFRKNMIMASDAPKIMGASPYGTPLSVWEEKLDLRPPQESNYWMKRGIELEVKARDLYNTTFGTELVPKVAVSNKVPFMGASLDGLSSCGKRALEIKCPGGEDHSIAMGGIIPLKYYHQLQHQMFVLDLPSLVYMSYQADDNWCVIDALRNTDQINAMLVKEREFWLKLKTFEAPEHLPDDYIYRDDESYSNAVKKWFSSKAHAKTCLDHEEQCKADLLKELNYRNTKGLGFTIKKIYKKNVVVREGIPYLKGVDLDKYRGEKTEFWRITEG